MRKSLNDIYEEIIIRGNIDNEIIEAFIEIDGMCSSTSMAWMIDLLKKAYMYSKNNNLKYEGRLLTEENFKNLMKENLSDYVTSNIFKEN